MNDIDYMPSKCHDCPYWMQCEDTYICTDEIDSDMFEKPDITMLRSLLSTK